MTSYSNPFYEYMRNQKYKDGVRCLIEREKSNIGLAELYQKNYEAQKRNMKSWRRNMKNIKVLKNRFANPEVVNK